jgi:hypothetical protein
MQGKMNAVYIHIPRTAGRYIAAALALHKYIYFSRMRNRFDQTGLINIGHQSYKRLLRKGIIGKEFDKTSFKFTFCRNPFDRVVSHYHYARIKHPSVLPKDISFENFVMNLEKYNVPRTINKNETFRAQVQSIIGVNMDFIGRFENLTKDIQRVADILNIRINDVNPIGATRHKAYQEYYTPELEKKISEFYKEDFDFFGYDNNILH